MPPLRGFVVHLEPNFY